MRLWFIHLRSADGVRSEQALRYARALMAGADPTLHVYMLRGLGLPGDVAVVITTDSARAYRVAEQQRALLRDAFRRFGLVDTTHWQVLGCHNEEVES